MGINIEKIRKYYINYNIIKEIIISLIIIATTVITSSFITYQSFSIDTFAIIYYLGIFFVVITTMSIYSLFMIPRYAIFSFTLGFGADILAEWIYTTVYSFSFGKGGFIILIFTLSIQYAGLNIVSLLNIIFKNTINKLAKSNKKELELVISLFVIGYIVLTLCVAIFVKKHSAFSVSILILAGFIIIALNTICNKLELDFSNKLYNILIFIIGFLPSLFIACMPLFI